MLCLPEGSGMFIYALTLKKKKEKLLNIWVSYWCIHMMEINLHTVCITY
jgi:hypothetical protein